MFGQECLFDISFITVIEEFPIFQQERVRISSTIFTEHIPTQTLLHLAFSCLFLEIGPFPVRNQSEWWTRVKLGNFL